MQDGGNGWQYSFVWYPFVREKIGSILTFVVLFSNSLKKRSSAEPMCF